MSQSSLRLSARSYLIAGVSAAVVGAAVVTPASVPALSPAKIAAYDLASVTTPLEDGIKNLYNAVEPWAAWGAELGQWALGFIPGLWWIAPGIDLAYFTIEPLVQAGVFTVADIIGLDFAQIGPDIRTGIGQAGSNFITYGLAWLQSLVPFPPLPPFPPGPFAAASAQPAAAAGLLAGPAAKSVTTPIENAIKNTYNWAEGWANYAMQWADYVLGRIPVVNWFSPIVPLLYNTIEPLVRGGVYTVADLIGLNFTAIIPDIGTAVRTSINNAIAGVLNWINVPFPPSPPRSAATVPLRAASLRAAAAVTPDVAEQVSAPEAPDASGAPDTSGAPEASGAGAPEADTAKAKPAPEAPVQTSAQESDAPAAVEAPAKTQVRPSRLARLGRAAAAAAGGVKAEAPTRTARSDRASAPSA